MSDKNVLSEKDDCFYLYVQKSTPRACDRTSISDRAAAIIVGVAFQDMGLCTKDKMSRTLNRQKRKRQREKL
jgi:hypothetical protein